LELRTLNNEVKARQLSQESLQVESTILHKRQIFVADGFLGWRDRDGNTREAFSHDLPEREEFVVATFTLELTGSIPTPHIIGDVATVVLGVFNRKLEFVIVSKILILLLVDSGIVHLLIIAQVGVLFNHRE
jgi:hypothetical protein